MADSTGFYSSFQSNIGGNNYYSDQSRRATDDFAVTKNYSDSDAHSSTASSQFPQRPYPASSSLDAASLRTQTRTKYRLLPVFARWYVMPGADIAAFDRTRCSSRPS
eukprot:3020724-Rhodomonas_salina.3